MLGAMSSVSTRCGSHEKSAEHPRLRSATAHRLKAVSSLSPHTQPHSRHDRQNQNHHFHHNQQVQHHSTQPLPPHSKAYAAAGDDGLPILPPHLHSMLYHSILDKKMASSPLWGYTDLTASTNPDANTTNCLQTPKGNQQQPQPHGVQPRFCRSSPAYVRFGKGIVSAEKTMPLQSSTTAPSPWSEDASLGNGSGSPFTTRGCQTTDVKRQQYTSSVTFSPAVSPSETSRSPSMGLTGRALERELLAAENEELVQILLELSSCNEEAAHFIQRKVHLFAILHVVSPKSNRHRENSGSALQTNFSLATGTREAVESATTALQCLKPRNALSNGDCFDSSAHLTPCKPLAFGNETPIADNCSTVEPSGDVTPSHHLSGIQNSEKMLLLTPPNQSVVQTHTKSARVPVYTVVENNAIPSEEQSWCSELHACLWWYGNCRHPSSCPFASLPKNLCLNWVRGSCVMGSHCSGVHRLPDVCPVEVRTLFDLNHGADRDVIAREKLQPKKNQPPIVVDSALGENNIVTTPKRQIIVDPVSIPGSLEHYQHELYRCVQEKSPSKEQAVTDKGSCNCRSCQSPEEENFQAVSCSMSFAETQKFLYPTPPPAQQVSRCLNQSFTNAANLECNALDATKGHILRSPWSSSKCLHTALCENENENENENESDVEGVEVPPANVHTRIQSPIAE